MKAEAIRARWAFDVRYGTKMEAAELLVQWVQDIGSQAGLTRDNVRINSGAVGSPESRFELEVEFASLQELETFWASIPGEDHKKWSAKMQKMMVDGSPKWDIWRTVEAFPATGGATMGSTQATNSGKVLIPTTEDIHVLGESISKDGSDKIKELGETTSSGLSIVSGDDDVDTVLDWKGDVMKINPGDKLPFKFQ